MLQKFAVTNFKNFNKKIEFDLGSTSNYEFNTEAISNKLIKNSLIYGKNGSGKSNLIYAIMDITCHLTDHEKLQKLYLNYTNLDSSLQYATFEYIFKFGEDTCSYIYSKYDYETLRKETLYINDEKVLEYSFEDETDRFLNIAGTENLKKDTGSSKLSFLKFMLNNSVLDQSDNGKILTKLGEFVSTMLMFNCLDGNTYQGFQSGSSSLSEYIIKNNKLKEFNEFLTSAGLHYNLKKKTVDGNQLIYANFKDKEVDFFSVASKGTRALTLFYYWMIDFERISFLVVDEFDAFYHNKLARFIVETAKSKDVQCIMTTHNTGIMDNDLLRPDCYYALKNNEINSFAKSTKKDLRKAHNIEKMYRAGAFDNGQ